MWIFKVKDKNGIQLVFITIEDSRGWAAVEAEATLVNNGYAPDEAKKMVAEAETNYSCATLIKPL